VDITQPTKKQKISTQHEPTQRNPTRGSTQPLDNSALACSVARLKTRWNSANVLPVRLQRCSPRTKWPADRVCCDAVRRSRCAVASADTDDADVVGPLFAAREADITGGS